MKNFRDDSGQAITEYLLLLSVIMAAALAFSRGLIRGISSGVLSLGGQLEKDLKTGRVKLGIWKN